MPTETRRYSIAVHDLEADQEVFVTAADWTGDELRAAIAQVMRLAGLPGVNCLTDDGQPS